jgi:hypothetical protein
LCKRISQWIAQTPSQNLFEDLKKIDIEETRRDRKVKIKKKQLYSFRIKELHKIKIN